MEKSSFFTLTRPMLFFPMFPRILISTLGFKTNNNIKRKSNKVKQATRLLLLVISSRRYKGINSHKLPSRYHQRNFLHNVTESNSWVMYCCCPEIHICVDFSIFQMPTLWRTILMTSCISRNGKETLCQCFSTFLLERNLRSV